MSGGGSSPAQPSTTTSVQDIPAWEQPYVENLLGQAQANAAQPYQQFQGPQVAGFTGDQNTAFSNIENAGSTNVANQQAAMGQAQAGANTTNGIVGAGAGDINASTGYNPLAAVSPYLQAATGYNSAAAAQPWLNQAAGYENAAANAGTPQGIQSYMSPYTGSVVQGLQDEANLNWNQNIMPGVNDKFVGSGQYGSGRNAQVLGQAAGNFQTGLSANVANALQSGYSTASTDAQNQANLLSGLGSQSLTGAGTASGAQTSQISNLLNQAGTADTATNQQAANLQGAGTALGNLQATQGAAQLNAGTTLGNLGAQNASTDLTQNQALQAVGQQQQELNQTNLNTAMTNFQNQVNYPEQQTEYLNQIIRGLPAPSATTSSTQTTPAYSTSPLAGIGGAGIGALALTGSNGQNVGTATGLKRGGMVKKYADGGVVTADDPLNINQFLKNDDISPEEYMGYEDAGDSSNPLADAVAQAQDNAPVDVPQAQPVMASPLAPQQASGATNPLRAEMTSAAEDAAPGLSQSDMQQQKLLALAAGMLTPSLGGNVGAAFGQGLTNVNTVTTEQNKMLAEQKNNAIKNQLEQEKIDQGKYTPIKDMYGNVTGIMDTKSGKMISTGANPMSPAGGAGASNTPIYDSLPRGMQSQVDGIIAGRIAPPSPGSRGKGAEMLLAAASERDPTFDTVNYAARSATRKSFTSGKDASNITALNTAISHLGNLQNSLGGLNNGGNETINQAENWAARQYDPKAQDAQTKVGTDAIAVSHELASVFRQIGMSEGEIKDWQNKIDTTKTPAEQKAVIGSALDLMDGRLNALGDKYNQGMGTTKEPLQLLSPKSQQMYKKLRGNDTSAADTAPAAAAATPAPLDALLAEKQRRAAQKNG